MRVNTPVLDSLPCSKDRQRTTTPADEAKVEMRRYTNPYRMTRRVSGRPTHDTLSPKQCSEGREGGGGTEGGGGFQQEATAFKI